MKIGVIGAGRLGLCFALLCEKAGYEVLASDVREGYIRDLKKGVVGTPEPGVHELLWNAKNIEFTTDNERVILESDIIYTLVATPSTPHGDYDVSAVWQVVEDIRSVENVAGKAFVVGCTTNPGDCDDFQASLKGYEVNVFYNPEFIAQGSIIKDLQYADMVLIVGESNKTYDQLCKLYNRIQVTQPQISIMSLTAAELVKLAVNCFLTTKISYANMVGEVMSLSAMSEEIDTVLGAIGADSRIGNKYLKYGYGYGGPCLPRDNRAFAAYAKKLNLEYNLGETTDKFNDEHSQFLVDDCVSRHAGLPFYFDYVSYKKGTDIITESQQLRLAKDLLEEGYTVYINDLPVVIDQIRYVLSQYGDRVKFEEPTEEVYRVTL